MPPENCLLLVVEMISRVKGLIRQKFWILILAALTVFVLVGIGIQRWPTVQLVLETRAAMPASKFPALYLNPLNDVRVSSCDEPPGVDEQQLKIGRTSLRIHGRPIVEALVQGNGYVVSYPDGRRLTLMAGIPDIDTLSPTDNSESTRDSYRRLIDDDRVSGRASALQFILSVTPDALSIWDTKRQSIAKVVALHLKLGLVPITAESGFTFNLDNAIKIIQIGDGDDPGTLIHAHVTTPSDEHLQVFLRGFSNEQIQCMLSGLSPMP